MPKTLTGGLNRQICKFKLYKMLDDWNFQASEHLVTFGTSAKKIAKKLNLNQFLANLLESKGYKLL
jgi:hypothetical protein